MYAGKRFVAIVPARGGSKAVPRKNVRLLGGRPLLAYTVDQAHAVPEIDLTVVSTEDSEIRRTALDLGAQVISRPPALAKDDSPTEPALLHALDILAEDFDFVPDYVVVLEPTSPFRRPETIYNCMVTIVERRAESLLTVRESRENIGALEDGYFRPMHVNAPRRRQDRTPLFIESSTVYVCDVGYLRAAEKLIAENWAAYVVPELEAIDINTLEDFALAECLMRARKEGK